MQDVEDKLSTQELANKFNVKLTSVYEYYYRWDNFRGYIPCGFVPNSKEYMWELDKEFTPTKRQLAQWNR